jgi:hypothetical protein
MRRSVTVARAERITMYTARVIQTNYLDFTRLLIVEPEFGGRVDFRFTDVVPADWLRIDQNGVAVHLASDRCKDVYHLLQTESPVFCTAGNFFGLEIGSVHTELDLSRGEPTGEGYDDRRLEAIAVRARAEGLTGTER